MVDSLHPLHRHSRLLWTAAHHLPLLPAHRYQGVYTVCACTTLIKKARVNSYCNLHRHNDHPPHQHHPLHFGRSTLSWWKCLWCSPPQVKSSGARAGFTKRRRSERKVTRMVVVIVVVFVLCWLPFFIINMVNLVVIIPESSATAGIYFFAVILSYANSCANPVLYGFLSDNLKQSFRKVGWTYPWFKTVWSLRKHSTSYFVFFETRRSIPS